MQHIFSLEKKVCFIFYPHPYIHRKRAKLSTLNLLSNSFSLENYGFEEWSWYVICSVYYKSEFSQYFCFVLSISWELCNQSRCLQQSRKRPLWIRENLVHSIFCMCVWERGAWQQSKYMALFSVYYTGMLHLFKSKYTHHTCIHFYKKKSETIWLRLNASSKPLTKCLTKIREWLWLMQRRLRNCQFAGSLLWKMRVENSVAGGISAHKDVSHSE